MKDTHCVEVEKSKSFPGSSYDILENQASSGYTLSVMNVQRSELTENRCGLQQESLDQDVEKIVTW